MQKLRPGSGSSHRGLAGAQGRGVRQLLPMAAAAAAGHRVVIQPAQILPETQGAVFPAVENAVYRQPRIMRCTMETQKDLQENNTPIPMPIRRRAARRQDLFQISRSAKVQGRRTPIHRLGPARQRSISTPSPPQPRPEVTDSSGHMLFHLYHIGGKGNRAKGLTCTLPDLRLLPACQALISF